MHDRLANREFRRVSVRDGGCLLNHLFTEALWLRTLSPRHGHAPFQLSVRWAFARRIIFSAIGVNGTTEVAEQSRAPFARQVVTPAAVGVELAATGTVDRPRSVHGSPEVFWFLFPRARLAWVVLRAAHGACIRVADTALQPLGVGVADANKGPALGVGAVDALGARVFILLT